MPVCYCVSSSVDPLPTVICELNMGIVVVQCVPPYLLLSKNNFLCHLQLRLISLANSDIYTREHTVTMHGNGMSIRKTMDAQSQHSQFNNQPSLTFRIVFVILLPFTRCSGEPLIPAVAALAVLPAPLEAGRPSAAVWQARLHHSHFYAQTARYYIQYPIVYRP